ncbi:MAG TPA: putative metallopeptidase [Planctomycetota bacterium]|nr:putative metallopeptidase [Planctomycetota bacterium]
MFDYAEAMRRLIGDIIETCDAFRHVKASSLLVGCIKARNSDGKGLYARTVPLRFEGGSLTTQRRGREFRVPVVQHAGNEVLYIVSFCLPRFQNLPFHDKLVTIFHELYHVSPKCDGDIRRFDGANYVHTSSQERYDELMKQLATQYVERTANPELHDFLKYTYAQLSSKYDGIRMKIFKAPKPQLVRDNLPLAVEMKQHRKGRRK